MVPVPASSARACVHDNDNHFDHLYAPDFDQGKDPAARPCPANWLDTGVTASISVIAGGRTFDQAELTDDDRDGFAVWQEFIADTNEPPHGPFYRVKVELP